MGEGVRCTYVGGTGALLLAGGFRLTTDELGVQESTRLEAVAMVTGAVTHGTGVSDLSLDGEPSRSPLQGTTTGCRDFELIGGRVVGTSHFIFASNWKQTVRVRLIVYLYTSWSFCVAPASL